MQLTVARKTTFTKWLGSERPCVDASRLAAEAIAPLYQAAEKVGSQAPSAQNDKI
jgi:hypothetical protein